MFSSATARVIAGCAVGDAFHHEDSDSDESSDCPVFDITPVKNAHVSPRDVGMHPEEEVPCPLRPRNAPTFPKLKGGDRRMRYYRKMSKAHLDRTWLLRDNSNEVLRREGELLMKDWKDNIPDESVSYSAYQSEIELCHKYGKEANSPVGVLLLLMLCQRYRWDPRKPNDFLCAVNHARHVFPEHMSEHSWNNCRAVFSWHSNGIEPYNKPFMEMKFYKELFDRGGYHLKLKDISNVPCGKSRTYHIIPKTIRARRSQYPPTTVTTTAATRITRSTSKQRRSMRLTRPRKNA